MNAGLDRPFLPPPGVRRRDFAPRRGLDRLRRVFLRRAMSEKCTEELKLRLPENLLLQLSRLAHADDRKLSEYIRFVLSSHVFGHAVRLDEVGDE